MKFAAVFSIKAGLKLYEYKAGEGWDNFYCDELAIADINYLREIIQAIMQVNLNNYTVVTLNLHTIVEFVFDEK